MLNNIHNISNTINYCEIDRLSLAWYPLAFQLYINCILYITLHFILDP